MIHCVSTSETGLVRRENQDVVLCRQAGDYGVFLVADGMGGHTDGAYASAVVQDCVRRTWDALQAQADMPGFQETVRRLKAALAEADQAIRHTTEPGQVCGTTCVLLLLYKNSHAVLSVGDSRIYRADQFSPGIQVLTTDDVWENDSENVRGLSAEEICNHPNYGYLTRAIGAGGPFSCAVSNGILMGKTAFALMSDGVYRCCSERFLEAELARVLEGKLLEGALSSIRNEVYQNGAGDNFSLVLVRAAPAQSGRLSE